MGEGRQARWERERNETLVRERELWAAGLCHLAGVDEVGVGPLAGPVVAAAVVFPQDISIDGVRDSKKLSPARREKLCAEIETAALATSIGVVDVQEVDRLNPYHAALEAMRRAVVKLGLALDHLLVDARRIPDVDVPQTAIVKGDASVYSIAAASIVAKVRRDTMMAKLDLAYPGYGFARNAGYGTAEHFSALDRLGVCPVHRRSFSPVRERLARS